MMQYNLFCLTDCSKWITNTCKDYGWTCPAGHCINHINNDALLKFYILVKNQKIFTFTRLNLHN